VEKKPEVECGTSPVIASATVPSSSSDVQESPADQGRGEDQEHQDPSTAMEIGEEMSG
jgi:hypothetical protein